ncbi:nicotinamidase-like amidase [Rhizodiscina lignyota]|uniref:Nicotinamidase-like amidase n=1 Tax=Rhizodiscina lignyota TaxID=1504668 RepID=A0A9P4I5Z1_9PEZI|nr:nicotinamidase-like amidase [Rhizodiscina lignyota]
MAVENGVPSSLKENYASGAYASTSIGKRALPFSPRVALIVIDVCDAYLLPESPLYAEKRFDAALKSCERLISACRDVKIPVVFTRVAFDTPNAGGNWKKYKIPKGLACFDAGNPLGDYPKSSQICRPLPGELVISKQFSSSFFGTPLASQLKDIETLIICGFSTSGCVRATTVDAAQYGFFPYVVKDACGDRHEYPHEANLFDMQAKFGEVVSEDEIMGIMKGLPRAS